MKKITHTFKAFDAASIKATEEAWTAEAESGMAFPTDTEQLMAWTRGHMKEASGESVAYGIFLGASKEADAICEVAVTRKSSRSKWIKMLRVRLRPKIDEALNSFADGKMME